MNAFSIDGFAHAKLKSILCGALPGIKSSHRAEAIARGFGLASNAALLATLRPSATLVMRPARFAEYLASKGWLVPASVFVASCFLMRTRDLDNLYVPRWGTALFEGKWIGLVLWDGELALAKVSVPKGEHGPTWLAGVDLTGIPLTRFHGDARSLSPRFAGDARAALSLTNHPGGFLNLGPYLGGERFPYRDEEVPIYEVFGTRSMPIGLQACALRLKEARDAGHYASVVCL